MSIPKLFRVTVEVGDLDRAAELYRDLFGDDGERHRGARHYFDCDGTIVALIDVSQGGLSPTRDPSRCTSRSRTSRQYTSGRAGSASSRRTRFTANQPVT